MNKNFSLINIHLTILSLFIVFYILFIGSSLIIPFMIAILFSFAIIWLSNFYTKLRLPSFLAMLFSLLTYVFLFWLIWKMINSNVQDLIILLPEYQEKIWVIVTGIFNFINIPEPTSISQVMQKIKLWEVLSSLVWAITSIFSSAWIILFYVMFILLEYRFFSDKLNLMVTDKSKATKIHEILDKINHDVKSYFFIKTLVSLVTWTLSYIVMKIFGLDFAIFWAFTIFVLNFIPSVWSIIAVTFPVMLSLIQFESYYPFVFITSWLVWIQILMWNIIEPKFMWNKLNLSPLVIIISLWFWWMLWWIVGMLLSVPLMVMINIILARFDITRPIAVLLSEKWELDIEWWESAISRRKKLLNDFKKKIISKK